MHIWLRAENKPNERRSPLSPLGATALLNAGHIVTVESSDCRIYPDADYRGAGCKIVSRDSWTGAPKQAYILGLKELTEKPDSLHHHHIYFGHAYKEQAKASELLERFRRGNGTLLDIEYLRDADSKRVVAFGYWAGYVGKDP